jgi:hypothetical protein
MNHETMNHGKRRIGSLSHGSLYIVLVLWLAFALRVWQLTAVPPGLTHDEANHGREAIGILDGQFFYFFPLNYGSEPLYSYTVAAAMAGIGKNLLALRYVNVVFGLAAIALTYAWAARLLGRGSAWLSAALLALSFWPLASSRQALRAGMLPFFMLLAVWFFWQNLAPSGRQRRAGGHCPLPAAHRPLHSTPLLTDYRLPLSTSSLAFGLSIAATLHIYLAARVTWLLFPLFLLYLALVHRERFRRSWRPVLAGLLLAGLLAIPMFLYLRAHPEMQTRVAMLDRPLEQLRAGEWRPLLATTTEAILAFFWPGYGDQFLAYNIPGRPVLDALTAVFFLAGLLVCLWRWRQPVYAFLLLWWAVGILPSLVTGPTANTTRNLAALPAVYLLAAVGFGAIWPIVARASLEALRGAKPGTLARVGYPRYESIRVVILAVAAVWLAWVGWTSARDYFDRWGQSAEVRGAYQQTLVAALTYLKDRHLPEQPLVLSSVYPGPAHDPSIAFVLAGEDAQLQAARWVDARYALVIPGSGSGYVLAPASTPIHPTFQALLQPAGSVTLRPDDLDPGFTLFRLREGEAAGLPGRSNGLQQPTDFGAAVRLRYANWLAPAVRPGETAELLTAWEVLDPARAGPLVPPAYTTDAVFFTHLLDENGEIVAQRDGLDAPSWAWQPGDVILQIHPLTIPHDTQPGEYQPLVGIYDRTSGVRLPVSNPPGNEGVTTAGAPPLSVVQAESSR